jgi:hypothetical protein
MKSVIEKDTYIVTFDNLKEFMSQSVDKIPIDTGYYENDRDYKIIFAETGNDWRYGNEKTREKFLEQRMNPTKGKTLCKDDISKTMFSKEYQNVLKQALTYKKRNVFVESGVRLSVPKAISGEDKSFVVLSKGKKPTVKLAINIAVSCGVDDKDIMKIAKTAILTTYALETAGIPTEIWFCTFGKGQYITDQFKYDVFQVKIKSAEERFSWTTFAPVFTVGAYRHTFFLSWLKQPYAISPGYGHTVRSDELEKHNNFGYAAIIGPDGPGPIDLVTTVFEKLVKK